MPPPRCATCSCPGRYLFTYGVFYPAGRDARLRRQDADVPGRPRPRLRPREAGLVGQADLPDGRLLLPLAVRRRRAELARVPGRHRHDRQQGRRPPGDRHDLAPHLRPLERVPHDRRGSLPQGRRDRRRVPARAPAQRRHERGRHLLVPRHRDQRAEREEDPRLGIRRRLPGDPGVRADLRAGRPDPAVPDHRRSEDQGRHRLDDLAVRALLLRPRERRLLVAPRPDLVRRQERRARPQPGAQELELGRRPRAGLPDQRLARHRRRQVHGHAGRRSPTRSRSTSPTTPTARSSRSDSTRTGATT